MLDRSGLTIAALSTPPGRGGVALLRLSGKDALPIAEKVFTPVGKLPLTETPGNRVRYGDFFAGGKRIDRGLVTVFRAPHSYTGEDTVELCCHGGVLLCTRILEALYEAGAVPAEPGEFTRRAFVAGKLGLTEAEAVMDAIDAESDAALEIAAANMTGALGKAVGTLADRLTALLAAAYVCGDYPDEDLADLTPAELLTALRGCLRETESLRATYRHGHALTEGIGCAIIGRPNVGKSSLLNALLGRDRAIVSPEAGTTRDTVEETVYFGNVKLRLIDTAGIREGAGEIERLGVRRSFAAAEKAELILAVFDGSRPETDEDAALWARLREQGKPVLPILNKADLLVAFTLPLPEALSVSTRTGEGLDTLRGKIRELFENDALRDPSVTPIVASARQYAALGKAAEAMQSAIRALEIGFTPDTAGLDMEAALSALLEVDGRAALDLVVDNIFHRFCVGK